MVSHLLSAELAEQEDGGGAAAAEPRSSVLGPWPHQPGQHRMWAHCRQPLGLEDRPQPPTRVWGPSDMSSLYRA